MTSFNRGRGGGLGLWGLPESATVFTYIFTKKHLRQRLVPPPMGPHPQWEILDPPLHTIKRFVSQASLQLKKKTFSNTTKAVIFSIKVQV